MNNLNIKSIVNWFETAVPEPTEDNKRVQIGCHLEEVAEMLSTMERPFIAASELNKLATEFKTKEDYCSVSESIDSTAKKVELLDALCDQIVTAIGVAHMYGMDIEGALNEVDRANWSKFKFGKPIFDENGKIAKSKYYSPPSLHKFTIKQEDYFVNGCPVIAPLTVENIEWGGYYYVVSPNLPHGYSVRHIREDDPDCVTAVERGLVFDSYKGATLMFKALMNFKKADSVEEE